MAMTDHVVYICTDNFINTGIYNQIYSVCENNYTVIVSIEQYLLFQLNFQKGLTLYLVHLCQPLI